MGLSDQTTIPKEDLLRAFDRNSSLVKVVIQDPGKFLILWAPFFNEVFSFGNDKLGLLEQIWCSTLLPSVAHLYSIHTLLADYRSCIRRAH